MFVYEKKLQYPVKIKNTNPALAKFIISQYGGRNSKLLRLKMPHLAQTAKHGMTFYFDSGL